MRIETVSPFTICTSESACPFAARRRCTSAALAPERLTVAKLRATLEVDRQVQSREQEPEQRQHDHDPREREPPVPVLDDPEDAGWCDPRYVRSRA